MTRSIIVAAAIFFALPVGAQSAKNFSQADANAQAQLSRHLAETSSYAEKWAMFNNQHHLDERDGCYFKAEGELTQILEIDKSGKVVGYYADQDNGRSRCWRATYLGVVFPKPPFAPYWHKGVMH